MKLSSATRFALILVMAWGCLIARLAWGQQGDSVDLAPFAPPLDQWDDMAAEDMAAAGYGHQPNCGCPECGSMIIEPHEAAGGFWGGGLPFLMFPTDVINFRHSATDGRYTGKGQPLHGTSWLNRPYEVGLEAGAFLMAGRVASHVRANNDLMAAIHLGWDWDHYWGTQVRVAWSTPAIGSGTTADPPDSSDIFIYDLSVLYYPWGDSKVRPYYRLGVGLTDLDYINADDLAQDATLFTIPFGVGLKYQTQRWMAWRVELVDNLAFGQSGTRTLNNFTLSFGAEWRFGGKPAPRWYSPSANQVW